jgi:hypothetical protein
MGLFTGFLISSDTSDMCVCVCVYIYIYIYMIFLWAYTQAEESDTPTIKSGWPTMPKFSFHKLCPEK